MAPFEIEGPINAQVVSYEAVREIVIGLMICIIMGADHNIMAV